MAPVTFGHGAIILDEAATKRVGRFVKRVGIRRACDRLRIGEETLRAARDFGRMKSTTASRLLEALAREEAVAS